MLTSQDHIINRFRFLLVNSVYLTLSHPQPTTKYAHQFERRSMRVGNTSSISVFARLKDIIASLPLGFLMTDVTISSTQNINKTKSE